MNQLPYIILHRREEIKGRRQNSPGMRKKAVIPTIRYNFPLEEGGVFCYNGTNE